MAFSIVLILLSNCFGMCPAVFLTRPEWRKCLTFFVAVSATFFGGADLFTLSFFGNPFSLRRTLSGTSLCRQLNFILYAQHRSLTLKSLTFWLYHFSFTHSYLFFHQIKLLLSDFALPNFR